MMIDMASPSPNTSLVDVDGGRITDVVVATPVEAVARVVVPVVTDDAVDVVDEGRVVLPTVTVDTALFWPPQPAASATTHTRDAAHVSVRGNRMPAE